MYPYKIRITLEGKVFFNVSRSFHMGFNRDRLLSSTLAKGDRVKWSYVTLVYIIKLLHNCILI